MATGPFVTRGYSGVLTVEITVPGVSGHAARPDGVSAREKALVVKEALDAFKRDRESSRKHAAVNLGILRAGIHPAVIPGEAFLALNMSYPIADARAAEEAGAGFGGAPIRADFERRIRERESQDPFLATILADRVGEGSDSIRDAGGSPAGDRPGRDAPRGAGGGAIHGGEPRLERRLLPAGALRDSDGGLWRRRARQGALRG